MPARSSTDGGSGPGPGSTCADRGERGQPRDGLGDQGPLGLEAVLLGARTSAQLSESLAAEDVELPDEIVQALDDVSSPHGWES